MIDIDEIERIAKGAPAGKWEIHTSNSWRRVFANQGREKVRVIEPTTQHDRWPDLMFGPGVKEWLEGVTPEMVLALIAEVRALREDKLMLGFDLLGVITDVEQGHGFDDVCLDTIKRVCKKLGDAARGAK